MINKNINSIDEKDKTLELQKEIEELKLKIHNQELIIEHFTQYNKYLENLLFSKGKEQLDSIMHKNNDENKNSKKDTAETTLKEQIIEIKNKFSQANNAKDKFISIIAHDLINPLQTLILATEILAKNAHKYSTEQIVEECNDIHFTVLQLSDLLNNLMQWSKTQSGLIDYKPEYIDLEEIIDEVFQLFFLNAKRKNISLIKDIKRSLFPYSDKKMLRTILRNLLSNAIKFTNPGGQITVSAKSTKGYVQVTVSDTGIGIEKDVLNRLFKIEDHYTSPGTDGEKGTGFGLILCKDFTERNGGKIWLESVPNKGTKVHFTLPEKELI